MKEIKCPNCGEVFTVDESDYQEIVNQVRNKEFDKEVKKNEESIKKEYEAKLEKQELELKQESSNSLQELTIKFNNLQNELNNLKKEKDNELKAEKAKLQAIIDGEKDRTNLAIANAIQKEKDLVNEKNNEINNLNNKLELQIKEAELKEKANNENFAVLLKNKDDMINYYKDLKTKMSTKLVGETLEQHCSIEFNKIRATAFKNAYFEKDNDARTGSKGDFIFRDFDDEGTEIVSIMFEMKNEMDTTATKHKNEDFFKELDKDRNEKKCEYAVLVSMLEADSELYNQGIVDVSYKYEKMYVIRPQFFISLITMLKNANLKALDYKKEIIKIRESNIDIENFEDNLNDFKDKFGKNYRLASEKFKTAIEEIDKTIDHLEKTKKALLSSENNLRLANDKVEDVSIKKLTKNSPLLAEKFEELKK